MVIDNFDDLKDFISGKGRVGIWAIHSDIHDGHRACARTARESSDVLINVCHRGWVEQLKSIHGRQYYATHQEQKPDTFDELQRLSDAVFIHDFPIPNFNVQVVVPDFLRQNNYYMGNMLTSINLKIHFHQHLDDYVQCAGMRDPWRPYYNMYLQARYPKVQLITIDPVEDELGNNLAGQKHRLPAEYQGRIDRKLLDKNDRWHGDCKNRLRDIRGLKLMAWHKDPNCGFMFGRFAFGDNNEYWWTEAYRYEDLHTG